MRSVRARLTAWNGGVLAAILLAFAGAAYALLGYASIDQTDDALRQQLRTTRLTIAAHGAPSSDSTAAVGAVVADMQRRGYSVALADAGEGVLVTRPVRSERAEARLRQAIGGDATRPARVPAALLGAIHAHAGWTRGFSVPGPNGGLRVRLERTLIGTRPFTLAATEPLDEVDELLTAVRGALVVAIPLVLAIALGVGYLLARRALAPVAAMTAQAERIGARTLHERLAVANPEDELGRLAAAFNAVLDRIDRVLDQQRHFTADASHELRTPVAIIRSEAEVALGAASRTSDEYRDALGVIRDGSEQLSRIVDDMFLLARADTGQVSPAERPLYLDELTLDTVRRMRSLAARRCIEIAAHAPVEVPYAGDEELLRRVVVNLLDNAIKYAPASSTIAVQLLDAADGHRLRVSDAGPGIPPAARSFVFDRFYRADEVRAHDESAHGTGAGLGLSIAREIAMLHGGRLELLDVPVGTTFELFLPARPAATR